MKRTLFALSAVAINGAAAFWRMPCRGRLGLARMDPLVSPGEVAQHVHHIHGSSGFSETAGYEDLVNAECTSCAVTQDKSVYWAPALYFRHTDGTYELVEQDGGMLNYYFLFQDDNNPDAGIKAFPKGFRMIAGDSLRRNYSVAGLSAKDKEPEKSLWAMLGQTTQVDLAQRAVGFNCLDYDKPAEGTLYRHYMPEKDYLDANCGDGLRIELMFPSCWNGKDLDSPNHRDHVAYPDLVMTGGCPSGFDVKLPGLLYETIWKTNKFAGVPGEFFLANGDSQGFGYHADFMMGWEPEFLQQAVNQCTSRSGKIEDCSIFDIQSDDKAHQCKMNVPSALANEKVEGRVGMALPGDVPIQYGPEPATNPSPGPQTTTVAVPSVGYSEGAKPTGSVYLPGQIFKETSISTEAPSSTQEIAALAQPPVTPAPEPPVEPVDDGYEVVRTEYITAGNLVSMIIVKEKVEYVTVTTTTYTSTMTVGALKARYTPHMHRHQRRHGRR
ncbi:hypothetical protein OQA88_6391 [Cercophora sp. LCS_1]